MELTKECPICEKEVTSELSTEYCALCGMQVELSNCISARHGEYEKFFCNELCYEKHNRFYNTKKGGLNHEKRCAL